MAVTGLVMIGFLIVHALGNLQVFSGPLKINEYSASLRRLGPLLWIARGALLSIDEAARRVRPVSPC